MGKKGEEIFKFLCGSHTFISLLKLKYLFSFLFHSFLFSPTKQSYIVCCVILKYMLCHGEKNENCNFLIAATVVLQLGKLEVQIYFFNGGC